MPKSDDRREETAKNRQRFLDDTEKTIERHEERWRAGDAQQRVRVMDELEAMASKWPREAPLSSTLVRALGRTLIVEGARALPGLLLAAWRTLQGYLARFGAADHAVVLVRAGVSPQALYVAVRDAACKEGRYQLAETVNRRLLPPARNCEVREETIAEAWAAHARILEALGNPQGVLEHVARAKALLAQLARYDLLPGLLEAEARVRARGPAASNGEGAAPIGAEAAKPSPARETNPGATPSPIRRPGPAAKESTSGLCPPAPTIDDLPDMLDAKQAAVVLGVKRGTVYEWVKKGKLPHLSYDGSRVTRFRKPDLVAWRDAQAKPARPARTGGANRTLNLRGVRRRRP